MGGFRLTGVPGGLTCTGVRVDGEPGAHGQAGVWWTGWFHGSPRGLMCTGGVVGVSGDPGQAPDGPGEVGHCEGAALGRHRCPRQRQGLVFPWPVGSGAGCSGGSEWGAGGPGVSAGLTAPAGSWVELRCGPGGPEPEPSRLSSCYADVERMLLEAQLETESSDGALLLMGSPVWDEDGAGPASERPEDSDLRPPCSQPQPGCLHPRQRDVLDEAERREQRLPASLNWACTRHPQHLSPKEFAFVCSPQPVLWSLQGGAVGRKKKLFSSELLLLFIPSLLLSHVLTLGLGIYIGKRLAASSANPL